MDIITAMVAGCLVGVLIGLFMAVLIMMQT
jgi:uncharacterized membrane protein